MPITAEIVLSCHLSRLNNRYVKLVHPSGPKASLNIVRTRAVLRECWSAFDITILVIGHGGNLVTRSQ